MRSVLNAEARCGFGEQAYDGAGCAPREPGQPAHRSLPRRPAEPPAARRHHRAEPGQRQQPDRRDDRRGPGRGGRPGRLGRRPAAGAAAGRARVTAMWSAPTWARPGSWSSCTTSAMSRLGRRAVLARTTTARDPDVAAAKLLDGLDAVIAEAGRRPAEVLGFGVGVPGRGRPADRRGRALADHRLGCRAAGRDAARRHRRAGLRGERRQDRRAGRDVVRRGPRRAARGHRHGRLRASARPWSWTAAATAAPTATPASGATPRWCTTATSCRCGARGCLEAYIGAGADRPPGWPPRPAGRQSARAAHPDARRRRPIARRRRPRRSSPRRSATSAPASRT